MGPCRDLFHDPVFEIRVNGGTFLNQAQLVKFHALYLRPLERFSVPSSQY
jgi:hypothetical protein